jgi:uncharacterized protein YjbI with pentapeptide repeats
MAERSKAFATCDQCEGSRLQGAHCLAHLTRDEFDATVRRLQAGDPLDARGVRIDGTLLEKLLDALSEDKHDGVHMPHADFSGAEFPDDVTLADATFADARFTEASFAGSLQFEGAKFTGSVHFERARVSGTTTFQSARFSGNADFVGAAFLGEVNFGYAAFLGTTRFTDAEFSETAWFHRTKFNAVRFDAATFSGQVRFDEASFAGEVRFDKVAFLDLAVFKQTEFVSDEAATRRVGVFLYEDAVRADVIFSMAQFSRGAIFTDVRVAGGITFARVKVAGGLAFERAILSRSLVFQEASISGGAGFSHARIAGEADFERVSFSGETRFDRVTFGGHGRFATAQFSGDARFEDTVFSRHGGFNNATFANDVVFLGARVSGDAYFGGAEFLRATEIGPLAVQGALVLDGARFHERVVLLLAVTILSARGTTFSGGADLRVRWGEIALDGADFGRASTLSDLRAWPDEIDLAARSIRDDRRVELFERPRLVSLRGAHVAALALSGLDLRACRFFGAHGLASIRIEANCEWASAPGQGWTMARSTIAEEHQWRTAHRGIWSTSRRRWYKHARQALPWHGPHVRPPPWLGDRDGSGPLTAPQIAALYRSLRKAREDNKDEAEAGDLYYGEMEMRRLASYHQGDDGSRRSRSERGILTAYWLFSGYGLRASRALVSLAITIIVGAALLQWFGFHESRSFGRSLLFAVESSISLLRAPESRLSAGGESVQIALRLLGPLYFGLALLAVRARVKR